MRKKAAYLCILFLATLIFYGGAGVNLVTYCCGDCRLEGVAVLLEKDCCEVHGHEHGDANGHAYEHEEGDLLAGAADMLCGTEDACCDLERVSFDWNSASQLVINLQPLVTDLFSFGLLSVSLLPQSPESKLFLFDNDGPPIICPRIYLSLLTTLLI